MGVGLYHVNADPLREVGKTLHIMASSMEYKMTCVVNASKFLSGFEVPSYLSMFKGF